MTEVEYRGLLTDDEAETVTIINGLEGQTEILQGRIKKTKREAALLWFGGAASLVLFFSEHSHNPYNYEKAQYMSFAAAMTLGSITQFIREQRMKSDFNRKLQIADGLRQELDPAGLGLFVNNYIYYEPEHRPDYDDWDF